MHLCLFVAFSGAHHEYIKLFFFSKQAAQKAFFSLSLSCPEGKPAPGKVRASVFFFFFSLQDPPLSHESLLCYDAKGRSFKRFPLKFDSEL